MPTAAPPAQPSPSQCARGVRGRRRLPPPTPFAGDEDSVTETRRPHRLLVSHAKRRVFSSFMPPPFYKQVIYEARAPAGSRRPPSGFSFFFFAAAFIPAASHRTAEVAAAEAVHTRFASARRDGDVAAEFTRGSVAQLSAHAAARVRQPAQSMDFAGLLMLAAPRHMRGARRAVSHCLPRLCPRHVAPEWFCHKERPCHRFRA